MGGKITIDVDDDGHYHLPVSLNNRQFVFLIDSGATRTTLAIEKAIDIGININSLEEVSQSLTASGHCISLGRATIQEFRIGPFLSRDVPIMIVLSPGTGINVLGMDFLRLFTVSIDNEVMTLEMPDGSR